jgi:hypothetical protein
MFEGILPVVAKLAATGEKQEEGKKDSPESSGRKL